MRTELIAAMLMLAALFVALPDTASAQCAAGNGDVATEHLWRQRLAAWVPTLTFEMSNHITQRTDVHDRARPSPQTLGVQPPNRVRLAHYGRTVDVRVGAHWNVIEIIDSLSPVSFTDEPARCPDRVGAPTYFEIEEEP